MKTKILVKNRKKKLSLQDAFSIAYKWSQKHPQCINEDDLCIYRNEKETNACLIGALIPDSFRPIRLEGDVWDIWQNIKLLFVNNINIEKLRELQICHDDASRTYYKKEVKENLREFATKYKLKIPSL